MKKIIVEKEAAFENVCEIVEALEDLALPEETRSRLVDELLRDHEDAAHFVKSVHDKKELEKELMERTIGVVRDTVRNPILGATGASKLIPGGADALSSSDPIVSPISTAIGAFTNISQGLLEFARGWDAKKFIQVAAFAYQLLNPYAQVLGLATTLRSKPPLFPEFPPEGKLPVQAMRALKEIRGCSTCRPP